MSGLREFRDEDAGEPTLPTGSVQAVDPYRAPVVSSRSPSAARLARRPRISPEWTTLLGLAPYFATLVVSMVATRWLPYSGLAMLAWMVGVEAIVYLSRTLWIGPGHVLSRIVLSSLGIATVVLAPLFAEFLLEFHWTSRAELRLMVATSGGAAVAGVLVNAVLRAIGSRDVPFGRKPKQSCVLQATALAVVAAFAAAGFVMLLLRPHVLTRDLTDVDMGPGRFAAVLAVLAVAVSLITQTWRFGVRGLRGTGSWSTALFVVCAVMCSVPFVVIIGSWMFSDEPPPNAWTPLVAFVAVPVAREFFIRWAGYRAINVYAERLRRKKRRRRAAHTVAATANEGVSDA